MMEVMYHVLEVELTEEFTVENGEAEDELDFEEYCDINDVDMTDLGEFNDTVSYSSEAPDEMTVSLTEKFQVKEVVDKVRKVISIFRKSPTKMDDVFRVHSVALYGKERMLNIDCKTRWNSTYKMLQTFLDLQKCISFSLVDVQSNISIALGEWQCIAIICKVLGAILKATELLSRRDTTLLEADTVLSSLLKCMPMANPLGAAMFNALCRRINERRGLASIALQYLHNRGRQTLHSNLAPVSSIDHDKLANFLHAIWLRSNSETNAENEFVEIIHFDEPDLDDMMEEATEFEDIFQQEKKLLERNAATEEVEAGDPLTCLKEEMTFYENSGTKGKMLQYCHFSLLGLPPTSVEAERNFSVAGQIVTKLRTRLSDRSLKEITMLKAFFLSIKN